MSEINESTNTFICSHCGGSFDEDDLRCFGNEVFCPDCLDELTVVCERCGDRIWAEDAADSDTVFAAVAELERGYILDRQREGIAIAKLQGKYKGRKAKAVDEQLWGELYVKWIADEITAVEFMQRMGLSKSAFYRRVSRI